jgi:uncharacterized protein YjbI with pentapeptide repeats
MIFDILNRFSGEVQFTAEIECADDAHMSIKIGLAVKWAVKNMANLDGAMLNMANLNGASLNGASLNRASLIGASLDGAMLDRASLDGASLIGASLDGASLDRASLEGASLNGASLNRANLNRANLNRASLNRANLDRANGINDFVKSIQIEKYAICYTAENIQIGCQRHTHSEWSDFSDAQIRAMDGMDALVWWRKYKDWIFQTIELCPAKPTIGAKP